MKSSPAGVRSLHNSIIVADVKMSKEPVATHIKRRSKGRQMSKAVVNKSPSEEKAMSRKSKNLVSLIVMHADHGVERLCKTLHITATQSRCRLLSRRRRLASLGCTLLSLLRELPQQHIVLITAVCSIGVIGISGLARRRVCAWVWGSRGHTLLLLREWLLAL